MYQFLVIMTMLENVNKFPHNYLNSVNHLGTLFHLPHYDPHLAVCVSVHQVLPGCLPVKFNAIFVGHSYVYIVYTLRITSGHTYSSSGHPVTYN